MADESEKNTDAGGSGKGLMLALVVLAVLGGAAGFGGGYFLGRDAPKRVAAAPVAEGAVAQAAPTPRPEGEAAAEHGTENAAAEEPAKEPEPPVELQVLALDPIITNVSNPAGAWARLEASVVCRKDLKDAPEIVRARVAEQIMIYLRSITLSEVEGASGLLNFREDLKTLVKSLNPDEVQDVLIRTLVVE